MAFDGVSAIVSRDATALFYYSPPQKMEHKKARTGGSPGNNS